MCTLSLVFPRGFLYGARTWNFSSYGSRQNDTETHSWPSVSRQEDKKQFVQKPGYASDNYQ